MKVCDCTRLATAAEQLKELLEKMEHLNASRRDRRMVAEAQREKQRLEEELDARESYWKQVLVKVCTEWPIYTGVSRSRQLCSPTIDA
jgi:septal ring factor EnvC (AmiA/AmiB activator)